MADAHFVHRVALLSLHSSPLARLGGVDAGGMNLYVRRLAIGLSRAGIAVDVFTRRTDRGLPRITVLEERARLVQLAAGPPRHLPKTVLPLHLPAMVSSIRGFAEEENLEYDVLHSHYWLSGLAAMRFQATQSAPAPIVHMFHTLAKVKEFYLGQPDPSDSALRVDGERCVLGRADVVVGATEGEQREMVTHYGRTPAGFTVIPPGVDLDMFRPRSRAASRAGLGLEAKYVVLFVGRPDRLKGLDVLLHAAASLPGRVRRDLKLVLVGGKDARSRDGVSRFGKLAAQLGLQEHLDVRGHVDQDDLPQYYAAADICAVPSAYESFGMAAVEAMACQTPVVAFRVGGLASTIKDGQTGFLARAGSIEHYAERLRDALLSPDLDSMGRQARLSVQRFSWDSVVQRTLRLYRDVIAEYSSRYEPLSGTR